MGFLDPAYLAALAAVAIPLLIHILSRRRVPVIYFSSLRFLRPSDRRSMRRVNMRRLLLLLLRMVGVALIVLAFARPTIRGRLAALYPGEDVRTGCILLDRSYSMGYEQETGSLFDEAEKRVIEILGSFAPEDEVMIMLFDSSQELLYSGRADAALIEGILSDTGPSWGTTDLARGLRAGIELLDRSGSGARELYIVSDFQRSSLGPRSGPPDRGLEARGWGGAERRRKEAYSDSGSARVFLVPIKPGIEANASIERVGVPLAALHAGELATVEILVESSGSGAPERFPLELYMDGQLVIEREIVIGSGGYAREAFDLPTERAGWILGEAKKAPDRLRADDRRYFALRVMDRAKVLLVADREVLYLEQALAPEGVAGDIELAKKSYGGITSSDLDEADVVVLGAGGGPSGQEIAILERFVEGGGRVVVFIAPELATAADRLSVYALSIDFLDFKDSYLTISDTRAGGRLLGAFGTEDIAALEKLRFRAAAIIEGVPEGSELLLFSGGSPFIWEERRGEGGSVFIATDPGPGTGDLVLSPYFLPLLQQAVLASDRRAGREEGVLIGEPIPMAGIGRGDMRIFLPGAGSAESPAPFIVPSIVAERQLGENAIAEGDLPRAEVPGFVTLEAGGETLGVLAANVAGGDESELEAASAEEVADSLGLEHWAVVDRGGRIETAVRHAREGREITFGLILAAALILVIESILSQARFEGGRDVG